MTARAPKPELAATPLDLDPVWRAWQNAPPDDVPESEEERSAVAIARAELDGDQRRVPYSVIEAMIQRRRSTER